MRNFLYVFLVIIYCSCKNENSAQRIKPQRSTITESVYASVSIRPEVSYFPQSNRSGVIKEIRVEQGDIIKRGQVLFKMLISNADNRLIDAQLNLEQAKANYLGENSLLTNIKLELLTEEQQLHLDSLNFNRQKNLWNQNIGAKIDLDQAKIKYEATSNRYNALKKRYAQTYQDLENNYRRALNMLDNERTALADYTVSAEIDGKVYDIFKEVGEVINPQEQFAEIGSADSFKIEMAIDEIDITKINLGDTAIIALEAYPDRFFLAQVSKIYPKKDEGTQTFNIESTFIETPEKLYNGLSGEANIVVATRNNVLTIPADYLKSGKFVETKEGEKAVVTGIKNMDFVEIVSGIDTATTLIKPNE